MSLVSLNVGAPREVDWNGRPVTTAIFKQPVHGPRLVRTLNVAGDQQADLIGHGGEHRAVFVYQVESYRHWERFLGRAPMAPGTFGENFTVSGMPDEEVCIGDRFRVGGALLEVTQPRVTCFKVGIALGEPRMPALLYAHGRPGFYLRVLEEGTVAPGTPIEQVDSGPERLSVRETSALLYLPGHREADLRRALRIPALPEGWRRSFTALLEQGDRPGNRGLTAAATEPPAWQGFRPFRVTGTRMETKSVRSLELEPIDGEPLGNYEPGQYLTLDLNLDGASRRLLRTYSLSAAPSEHRWRISVKREPHGSASGLLHDAVGVGDVLPVGAPRGLLVLPDDELPLVFIGAGIGVTPLLAMLGAVAKQDDQGEVWWIYTARDADQVPHALETAQLLRRVGAHTHLYYTRPTATDSASPLPAVNGRISSAELPALGVPQLAHFIVCGPTRFMDEIVAGLLTWGVATERIHRESFNTADAAAAKIPAHAPAGPQGAGPGVSFARRRLTVGWDPQRYGSLLELAEACSVPVTWSCRTGVCHLCESSLVSGTVAYWPEPLDAPADGNALLCCSVPETDVVLDL